MVETARSSGLLPDITKRPGSSPSRPGTGAGDTLQVKKTLKPRRKSISKLPSSAAAYYVQTQEQLQIQRQAEFVTRSTQESVKEKAKFERESSILEQRKRTQLLTRQSTLQKRRAEEVKKRETRRADELAEIEEHSEVLQKTEMERHAAELETQKWEIKHKTIVQGASAIVQTLQESLQQVKLDIETVKKEEEQFAEWLREPKDVYMAEEHTDEYSVWIAKLKVEKVAAQKRMNDLKDSAKKIAQVLVEGKEEQKYAEDMCAHSKRRHEELVEHERTFRSLLSNAKTTRQQRASEDAKEDKLRAERAAFEVEQTALAAERERKKQERLKRIKETPAERAAREERELDERRAAAREVRGVSLDIPKPVRQQGFGSAAPRLSPTDAKSPNRSPAARRRSISRSPNARNRNLRSPAAKSPKPRRRSISKSPNGRKRNLSPVKKPVSTEVLKSDLKEEEEKMVVISSKVDDLKNAQAKIDQMQNLAQEHSHGNVDNSFETPLQVESEILAMLVVKEEGQMKEQKEKVRRKSANLDAATMQEQLKAGQKKEAESKKEVESI